MPIFPTLLFACIAPTAEDQPKQSPSQPKPKSQTQLLSGDKDIPISKINLGLGQEDLTRSMKDYLLDNDYYSSTQCLLVPLAHDDNKITHDEATKYIGVENGALLVDDFYTMFPGYWLDFSKGKIGTYETGQSEEEASVIERGVPALFDFFGIIDPSIEIREQLTDNFFIMNEDIPGSVNLDTLNQMPDVFRDCQKAGISGNSFVLDPGIEQIIGVSIKSTLSDNPGDAFGYYLLWTMMGGVDNSGFSETFITQLLVPPEDWGVIQDYCNHPEEFDRIMYENFPIMADEYFK